MTAQTQARLSHQVLTMSKRTYDFAHQRMIYRLRQLRMPGQTISAFSQLSPGLQLLWKEEADAVLAEAAECLLGRDIEVVD